MTSLSKLMEGVRIETALTKGVPSPDNHKRSARLAFEADVVGADALRAASHGGRGWLATCASCATHTLGVGCTCQYGGDIHYTYTWCRVYLSVMGGGYIWPVYFNDIGIKDKQII